jgi:universal stress protein A
MSIYQHIMIAADFSEHSQRVQQKALALAKAHQANLSLCHIVEDFPLTDFAYEPMISIDIDMRETMLDSAKKHCEELGKKLGVPTQQQWVEFGTPGQDIVRLADEHNVDLIVLGSHGRRGLKLLLGSTANAVLHHAECDVLAVRLKDN